MKSFFCTAEDRDVLPFVRGGVVMMDPGYTGMILLLLYTVHTAGRKKNKWKGIRRETSARNGILRIVYMGSKKPVD